MPDKIIIDNINSRIRKYTDRCEGLFVFNVGSEAVIRLEIVKKDMFSPFIKVLVKVSPAINERLSQNVWYQQNRQWNIPQHSMIINYIDSFRDVLTANSIIVSNLYLDGIAKTMTYMSLRDYSAIQNDIISNFFPKLDYEVYTATFREDMMIISIIHDYKFNESNNSIVYTISYCDQKQRVFATIISTVFKGTGNTWITNAKLSPKGYATFRDSISNIQNDRLKKFLYNSIEKLKDSTGERLGVYFLQINSIFSALNIIISDGKKTLPIDIIGFLRAWQANQNTIPALQKIVNNGLLPQAVLMQEQQRIVETKWIKIDDVSGSILEYTDKCEGKITLNQKGQTVAQINFLITRKDFKNIQTIIYITDMNRINRYVFGLFRDWTNANLNVPFTISTDIDPKLNRIASNCVVANVIQLERLYAILVSSNIIMDTKQHMGLLIISNIFLYFVDIEKTIDRLKIDVKRRRDRDIKGFSWSDAAIESNAEKIKLANIAYDNALALLDSDKNYYRKKVINIQSMVNEIQKNFPVRLTYKRVIEEKKQLSPSIKDEVAAIITKTEMPTTSLEKTVTTHTTSLPVVRKSTSTMLNSFLGILLSVIVTNIISKNSKKNGSE